MIPPAIPGNEKERIQALFRLHLLDTPREELFDTCVKVAVATVGASRGAISLVDHERQWFKAVFGDLPPETSRELSFCGHAIVHDDLLVVPDASDDPRFHDNPLVTEGGIAFYVGLPLRSHDGLPLGTLCVIHDQPIEITDEQIATLAALGECIETHLDLRLLALKLGGIGIDAQEEREILRELEGKHRAVLAMSIHDVSNPLTVAMGTAALLLDRPSLSGETREAVEAIASATEAASRLLRDLMSVARSKAVELQATFTPVDVCAIALSLAQRLRILAAQQSQEVLVENQSSDPTILADSLLVERMLRNLLDNGLKYAGPGRITIRLHDHGAQELQVDVQDEGASIPLELHERIFDPGFRAKDPGPRSGHGLGLAFCRQAAELHGGSVRVRDPAEGRGNSFVLTLQRSPVPPEPARVLPG